MTEFFKEIIGIYKEKTKLPIISTYLIVLIVWNWDILSIYIFATPNMETKICWIKNMVTTKKDHWLRILYPILIAFAYPLASLVLTFLIEFIMNPVKKKIKDIQLSQRKEAAAKLLEIEQERTGQKSLEQLRVEIESQRVNNESLTNQLKESTKRVSELVDENKVILEEKALLDKKNKKLDVDLHSYKELSSVQKSKIEQMESGKPSDLMLGHDFINYEDIYDFEQHYYDYKNLDKDFRRRMFDALRFFYENKGNIEIPQDLIYTHGDVISHLYNSRFIDIYNNTKYGSKYIITMKGEGLFKKIEENI